MKKRARELFVFVGNSNVGFLLFIEIFLGVLCSIFSSLFFVKIGKDIFQNDFLNIDLSVLHFFVSLRNPFLTKVMLVISFLGGDSMLLFATIIIALLIIKNYKKRALFFFFILSMGFMLNIVLKMLTHRERPDVGMITQQTYSFPSAHTMNSFILYATVCYFIFHFTRNKKLSILATLLSLLLIVCIGISRIYLGVHYPSDVLAGFIGGFWWFITALVLHQTIIFYKLFKESRK